MNHDYKPDPRQQHEIDKAKAIDDDKIHVKPWVEVHKDETIGGIQVGMSWEKFGSILGKLKFWKKKD